MSAFIGDTGKRFFELGLGDLKKRLAKDPERYQAMAETYTKWNLQVAWVVRKCQEGTIMVPHLPSEDFEADPFGGLLPEELGMDAPNPFYDMLPAAPTELRVLVPDSGAKIFRLGLDEAKDFLQSAHDHALTVAAKAGDEWAIRSYYPFRESERYWKDLYTMHPSLTHRFLAAGAAGRVARSNERLQHAVKAYLLFKERHPDSNVDMKTYVYGGNHLGISRFGTLNSIHLSKAASEITNPHSHSFPWLRSVLDAAARQD